MTGDHEPLLPPLLEEAEAALKELDASLLVIRCCL